MPKHRSKRWTAGILTLLALGTVLLLGCTQQQPAVELPTVAATAELPDLPAGTTLPPTAALGESRTPQPTPIRPTNTPRPTGTPVTPVINVSSPERGAQLVLGSDIQVSGLLERQPGQRVLVGLVSATGHQLAVSEAVVTDNAWRAGLTVPENVSGLGQLQAAIVDEADEVMALTTVPVSLVLDTSRTNVYLALQRPGSGEVAVADHNLYFDGFLQRSGGGFLRLSVWTDDCRNKVAEHGFSMRSSSYWQAFVVLPRNISGPACAVASVGTPGDEFWREAHVPITILSEEEGQAAGIIIVSPRAGDATLSGETILISGIAYGAPNNELNLTVLLDNGRIITEAIVESDDWGYWEQSIVLPFDVEGQAIIIASLGDPIEPIVADEVMIRVDPGPTPTAILPATVIATETPAVTATPEP